MTIRPATLDDLPATVDLLSSMDPDTMVFDERETWTALEDLITICPNQGYVAESDGAIIACVFLSQSTGTLHSLAVHPKYRRCAIATKLVCQILQDYFSRTKVSGSVQAIVSASNEEAIAFWAAVGPPSEAMSGGRFLRFRLKGQPFRDGPGRC
jgi:ribosomal protein S18 acetylase RimI-like enzyme